MPTISNRGKGAFDPIALDAGTARTRGEGRSASAEGRKACYFEGIARLDVVAVPATP